MAAACFRSDGFHHQLCRREIPDERVKICFDTIPLIIALRGQFGGYGYDFGHCDTGALGVIIVIVILLIVFTGL